MLENDGNFVESNTGNFEMRPSVIFPRYGALCCRECGENRLYVCFIEDEYETWIKCPQCGKKELIHSG